MISTALKTFCISCICIHFFFISKDKGPLLFLVLLLICGLDNCSSPPVSLALQGVPVLSCSFSLRPHILILMEVVNKIHSQQKNTKNEKQKSLRISRNCPPLQSILFHPYQIIFLFVISSYRYSAAFQGSLLSKEKVYLPQLALGLFVIYLSILLSLPGSFYIPSTFVPARFSTWKNSSYSSSPLDVCSVKPSFNCPQSAAIASCVLCCTVFEFLIKHLSQLPPVQVQMYVILWIHGT